MSAIALNTSASPAISRRLMVATYLMGGLGLAAAFSSLSAGDAAAASGWASAVAVGGSGLLSFLRHSVFHRSDAARMHWDYGERNDFQIEVGLANLAWGLVGIAAWAADWGTVAKGAVTLVFGAYLSFAAVLHLSEVASPEASGGGRWASTGAALAFAGALLVVGGTTVAAG